MNSIAYNVLAIAAAVSPSWHADNIPFMPPWKDETSFLERCIELRSPCFYSTTILKEDNKLVELSINVIPPDDARLVRDGVRQSFSIPHICNRTRVLSISARTQSSVDGQTKPVHLSHDESDSFICRHEIDESTIEAASKEGKLLVTRRVAETLPILDGAIGTLYMKEGAINRHIIIAAEGVPFYLDSPKMADGSVHRGQFNWSTILDDDRRGIEEQSYTIFSTIKSWAELAKGYEKHQRALLSGNVSALPITTLPDIEKIASDLRIRFPYRVTAENLGVYPRNSPEQINRLGVADCKDYVTLLRDALDALGIASTTIITSLKSTPPRSLVVPDPIWANHVIVYIPEFDAYFDLAAEENSLVDQTFAVYGKLGFRTDTGAPVIIH